MVFHNLFIGINLIMTSSSNFPSVDQSIIAIVGLGYVGLPLAVEFALFHKSARLSPGPSIIAYDVDQSRIDELSDGFDRTMEVCPSTFPLVDNILFTSSLNDLSLADVYIVTVPTPIDSSKTPDLSALKSASSVVGQALSKRNEISCSDLPIPFVVFESTVYPGATEEVCVPIIKSFSGHDTWSPATNTGFVIGYSPERINPGDNNNKLSSITKVVGTNHKISTDWLSKFYGQIISAGTHCTSSIAVAEAAKVIENTQRDLNIALINELSIIFSKLNINTSEVLAAASTKWNFIPFYPGLVGGHCIGVDPYYLTYKAQQVGYYPEVVLAGRRINDSMAKWISQQFLINLVSRSLMPSDSYILILGFTFKENCPDIRNTKVFDILTTLVSVGYSVDVVDPIASPSHARSVYNVTLISEIPRSKKYSGVIVAVGHDSFKEISINEWRDILNPTSVIFDVKGIVPSELDPIIL